MTVEANSRVPDQKTLGMVVHSQATEGEAIP